MAIKTPADKAQDFAQSVLSVVPVVILGSGASAAHGVPGMGALADHLTALAEPADWTAAEAEEWARFITHLQSGVDLETALQAVRPSERQTQRIATETRAFLLPADQRVFKSLLANRRALPLASLYRHFFNSTHTAVNVVTPNYDRLAEYAADAAEVSTFTGFGYGYLRPRARSTNTRIQIDKKASRTVLVWKVHGSLDWCQGPDRQIVSIPGADSVPDGYSPLLITPGIDKYRLTHGEPFRSIMTCCDEALNNARAYFCVGYGFNDEHVQTKLIERCDRESVPMVIITKELTPTAKAVLGGGRCRRYLAIEEGPGGAIAYMDSAPGGFPLNQPFWRLDLFLNELAGISL